MLTFRQFGVGCHVVNIAVKLVQGFHFHRSTCMVNFCSPMVVSLWRSFMHATHTHILTHTVVLHQQFSRLYPSVSMAT